MLQTLGHEEIVNLSLGWGVIKGQKLSPENQKKKNNKSLENRN